MSVSVDSGERMVRIPVEGPHSLLLGALCLGLSILYQVYFYDFEDGVLIGGEAPRLAFKLLFVALFLVAVRKYLSLSVFKLNLLLKIPLLFIAVTIIAIAPFLNNEYVQAVNLLFFMPLLLLDWNRPGGDRLYRRIWAAIVAIVAAQLLLDPLLKLYFQVGWSNAAVIGGMGNPNVFGVFLIAAGLASAILLRHRSAWPALILFVATVFTGSLAAAILGIGYALLLGATVLLRSPSKILLFAGVIVALLPPSTLAIAFLSDGSAVTHAFDKFVVLTEVLGGGSSGAESESIAVRVDYTRRGLAMLADAPLALLTGHPGGTLMYSGDGMWVALLVTYGLPLTLYFLLVNLAAIYRALRSGGRDLLFSACLVATTLAFLVTNRILDYWPAAFAYLLAFTYLITRGVQPARNDSE